MYKELITPSGIVTLTIRDAVSGEIRGIEQYKNMVVDDGKEAIADALRGNTSNYRGIISYCAVGTGTTAPDPGDSSLETEIDRKLISVRSASAKVATFETFFTASEAVGTLREAGLFGDNASATANSGVLYCRVAINRVKTANDTLTLTWSITIG